MAEASQRKNPYVSAGGLKMAHALEAFRLDVQGLRCADLGCSTGGFTDCLLQAGAKHVTAIDTAYGEFAWTLRNDARVTLLERTNALRAQPPTCEEELADLVVVDLGWTQQKRAIPAAIAWLKRTPEARIVTLIKPQYEAMDMGFGDQLDRGSLTLADARRVTALVLDRLPDVGVETLAAAQSPIVGGTKGRRRSSQRSAKSRAGNIEFLVILRVSQGI